MVCPLSYTFGREDLISRAVIECFQNLTLNPIRYVDPQKYYEACKFDVCGCDMGGDCLCYCEALLGYVKQCTNRNIVINWRTQLPECRKLKY